jgi:hypothetical protein
MKKNTNLTKLYLMVIALPRGKKEIIGDVLEKYDVTAYLNPLSAPPYSKVRLIT